SVKARWAERQATSMISEHWESYEALVAAMEKRASVAECCEVIE
ncbi:MAG: ATP-dependent Zn protease, partial [Moorea sp. SIO2I5]|nr:ATP-dependent Zn protease [Moorena sp. SIO2I5]